MNILHPFALGVAAGLGVAVPLGAIGVLIVLEGVERGVVTALGAAAGVAVVDAAYAAVAMIAATAAAPAIVSLGPLPRVLGGVVVIAIAGRQAIRLRSTPAVLQRDSPTPSPSDAVARSILGRFAVFVGLTAVNPATLLYFAAIVVPVAESMSPSAATAFVAGVAAASLTWQSGLTMLGASLRTRITRRGRQVTAVAGILIVGALGVVMIASALA